MKKSINSKIRYVGYFLIIMQGILLSILTVFLISQHQNTAFRTYGISKDSTVIYLSDISNQRQSELKNFLVNNQKGFVIKETDISSNGVSSIALSVGGNVKKAPVLNFLNQNLLNSYKLSKLLNDDNQNAILGVNEGSINSLLKLPHVIGSKNTYVQKLSKLLNDDNTINGKYVITGLGENKNKFMQELASMSGKSEDSLLKPSSGSSFDTSIFVVLYIGMIMLISLSLFVVFIILSIEGIEIFGKLTLLGYRKSDIYIIIYKKFLIGSTLLILPISLIVWFISGLINYGYIGLNILIIVGSINAILTLILTFMSATTLFFTSSINAIKQRLPKKRLYGVGILGYLVVSVFLIIFCMYIDKPSKQMQANAQLLKIWEPVSNYNILGSIDYSGDGTFINGSPSDKFNSDYYNWYKKISNENGVFFISSTYYSSEVLLNIGSGINNDFNSPFWELKFSPNYFSKIGMSIDKKDIDIAKNGVRLYLVPDTLSTKKRIFLESLIKSQDKSYSGTKMTIFDNKPKFKFVSYTPTKNIFTWSSDLKNPMYTKEPIIMVTTPENMSNVEASSLGASGFDSLIKFKNKQVREKYTSNRYLETYNLNATKPAYNSVSRYINGLQKQLMETLILFSSVIMFMIIILLFVLIALANVFRRSNQDILFIKKFLGYNFIQRYKLPVITIVSMTAIELTFMIVVRSTIGIVFISISLIMQLLILWLYMAKDEMKTILMNLKGK